MTRHTATYAVAIGSLAGIAGGLAEIVWIWTYAVLTNSDASLVARSVTDTVGSGQSISPVLSGVGIHMGLAAVLGVAVAFALRSNSDGLHGFKLYGAVTAALATVWVVNFFIVLPLINPQFADLVLGGRFPRRGGCEFFDLFFDLADRLFKLEVIAHRAFLKD